MKSTLIVIFNSDFSTNIPKLERLYSGRFTNIVYLLPDFYGRLRPLYDQHSRVPVTAINLVDKAISRVRRSVGKFNHHELVGAAAAPYRAQMLRVVGFQYHFYHFIAQAWPQIKKTEADWYWVIGDDVLLNRNLDENSLVQRFAIQPEHDSVLCDPEFHIIYDNWLENFARGSDEAGRRLTKLLGTARYKRVMERYRQSKRGDVAASVIGGFSDFFGFRAGLGDAIMEKFQVANRLRLFVEITVPNVLLGLSENPILTSDYIFWDYPNNRYDWQQTTDMLLADPDKLFAHPVKFSVIDAGRAAEFR